MKVFAGLIHKLSVPYPSERTKQTYCTLVQRRVNICKPPEMDLLFVRLYMTSSLTDGIRNSGSSRYVR
jgi:hypothetical protein